ncbi:MAG TPA: cysteine desulfurase family protein [Thermoanaerobaculia bacterium]|nr:cysteine desulfurase family protein [Thermoanaerobaculia bacterium]
MRIYLDNNATTPIHPAALEMLERTLRDVYGNASSIHKEGQTARRTIEHARESVARLIGASPRELVFTSGGTESNNAAIYGLHAARRGGSCHIVTTAIEHPSVREPLRDLEALGAEVTVVPVPRSGAVDADAVIAALRPATQLVAVMLANNETGVVQPVAEIARVCRERGIHFHCDAVQGAGKIDIDVEALGVDTLALSAHKLHAPKGIGALFVRRGLELEPHLRGGAQERRRRAGTENVPLAAAFGAAAECATETEPRRLVTELRDAFESQLLAANLNASINGSSSPRVPNTSSVCFSGGDAEGIAIGLDLAGIAVSTGAACSSGRVEPSRILLGMGLTPAEARSTIRFSLSRFTTREEVDRTVEVLREVVPRT